MPIANTPSDIWGRVSRGIVPRPLTELPGPLSERHQRFAAVLEFATPEAFLPAESRQAGRPREARATLTRSFLAKAIWNLPTTRHPVDRLNADPTLRRLCGWPRRSAIPSEATFSRASAQGRGGGEAGAAARAPAGHEP